MTATRIRDRIAVTVEDGVADIRLDRPDKMNALDHAMFDALIEAAAFVRDRKGVRAAVLSGEGRAFCAGLDFASFQAMQAGGDRSPPTSWRAPMASPTGRRPPPGAGASFPCR